MKKRKKGRTATKGLTYAQRVRRLRELLAETETSLANGTHPNVRLLEAKVREYQKRVRLLEETLRKRDAAVPTPRKTLPTTAGWFWWRGNDKDEWRMVQVIDFAAGFQDLEPHLAAYDVERRAWLGRTLRMWPIHDPIGEWLECNKPSTP